jgi:hypothetical protein
MNSQYFVNVIKKVVKDQSVKDTIENLTNPPGKEPPIELLEVSQFFIDLDDKERILVERILDMVAESTLFGLLCVIDGVRAIEGAGEKGNLELNYVKNNQKILLNDPKNDYLHDLI